MTTRDLETALLAWLKLATKPAVLTGLHCRAPGRAKDLMTIGRAVQNELLKAGWTRQECWDRMRAGWDAIKRMEGKE